MTDSYLQLEYHQRMQEICICLFEKKVYRTCRRVIYGFLFQLLPPSPFHLFQNEAQHFPRKPLTNEMFRCYMFTRLLGQGPTRVSKAKIRNSENSECYFRDPQALILYPTLNSLLLWKSFLRPFGSAVREGNVWTNSPALHNSYTETLTPIWRWSLWEVIRFR